MYMYMNHLSIILFFEDNCSKLKNYKNYKINNNFIN